MKECFNSYISLYCVPIQAESEAAKYMKQMLLALGFPKPPAGITAFQLFSKVESKVMKICMISSEARLHVYMQYLIIENVQKVGIYQWTLGY